MHNLFGWYIPALIHNNNILFQLKLLCRQINTVNWAFHCYFFLFVFCCLEFLIPFISLSLRIKEDSSSGIVHFFLFSVYYALFNVTPPKKRFLLLFVFPLLRNLISVYVPITVILTVLTMILITVIFHMHYRQNGICKPRRQHRQ